MTCASKSKPLSYPALDLVNPDVGVLVGQGYRNPLAIWRYGQYFAYPEPALDNRSLYVSRTTEDYDFTLLIIHPTGKRKMAVARHGERPVPARVRDIADADTSGARPDTRPPCFGRWGHDGRDGRHAHQHGQ